MQKEEPPKVIPLGAATPDPITNIIPAKQPEPASAPVEAAADVKQSEPAVAPPAITPVQPEKIKTVETTAKAPGSSITSYIWWLAPVLLACFGGLLAWIMNKSKDAQKAKMMLWVGLGLTVVYAAVIALIVLLPGSQSAQGTIIYHQYREGSWQINTMRPDGSNPSAFTIADNVNKYYNIFPSWCAATNKIVFQTNRDGNAEIYTMEANGSNQVNLTNTNYWDGQVDWSPDGKKIVFVSNRDGNNEIYTMDADGSKVQRLTVSKPVDAWPRWSPDGKKIVFNTDRDGTHEIYVMDGDGNNQQRLTTNESPDYTARWSLDGKKIVFISERDGNPEVYLMDATGSNQKRLTFNSAKDYSPCFSPDGSRIAYYSNTDGNDEIYAMNTEGGSQVRLTQNKDSDQFPVWISATLKSTNIKTPPLLPVKVCGGSDNVTNNKNASGEDYVHYAKVTPENSGTIHIIKVYSTKAGNVKVGIYEHDAKTDAPAR
ncbi:MAG: DUF5050 domain-containing protein, partial [Chloroflexi bacterium]|nr:DUF5050 domain-containing protein [Chloroflexota bacterium]